MSTFVADVGNIGNPSLLTKKPKNVILIVGSVFALVLALGVALALSILKKGSKEPKDKYTDKDFIQPRLSQPPHTTASTIPIIQEDDQFTPL